MDGPTGQPGDCGTVTAARQGLPYIVLHAATSTEKLEARGGTESTRRVREEGAYNVSLRSEPREGAAG